jgi:hypothetical protein
MSLGHRCLVALALLAAFSSSPAFARAETWTTQDVDRHIAAGEKQSFATAPLPPVRAATLTIRYGLWDSPDVTIEVFVNGRRLATLVADSGYLSPGPSEARHDVTGLLQPGVNRIELHATQGGLAIVGSLTIDYTPR